MQSCRKRSSRLVLFTLVAVGVVAAQLRPVPGTGEARQAFLRRFAAAALDRTQHAVRYDPAYVRLPYPGGDVPADTGVCTDEVIRAYRAVGIDLQKEVHEDMAENFSAYPRKWGRREPDPNIDHRRVPNLMVFFSRKGESLPITDRAEDYGPGDLVTWDLGGGLTHIGMVVDRKTLFTRRYMIVHNIGAGPKMEDVLFDWKITGPLPIFWPCRWRRPSAGPQSFYSSLTPPARAARAQDVTWLTDRRDVREINSRSKVEGARPMRTTRPKRDSNAGLGWQV